jgi:hypothetical protein
VYQVVRVWQLPVNRYSRRIADATLAPVAMWLEDLPRVIAVERIDWQRITELEREYGLST